MSTIFYSTDRFVTVSMMDSDTAVAITTRSIIAYQLNINDTKPYTVAIQIPTSHKIEAAEIIARDESLRFAAVVRLGSSDRVYVGFFSCATGKLINTTQQYRHAATVHNSALANVQEKEFVTISYVLSDQIYTWRTDQITQQKLELPPIRTANDIEAASIPTAVCCGAFLNRICLFVGATNCVRVLSADNNFNEICRLQVDGVPQKTLYNPTFQQLVVITDDQVMSFFELSLKHAADYTTGDQLTSFPVYSARFPCTAIFPTSSGYILGDELGRGFSLRIIRNQLRKAEMSTQLSDAVSENVIQSRHNKGLFVVKEQAIQQIKRQQIPIETEAISAAFPFAANVAGCAELLANQITQITTIPGISTFVCGADHTFVYAKIELLNQQDDALTQNLGFSDRALKSIASNKWILAQMSSAKLKEESASIAQQAGLQMQLDLLEENFLEISNDLYQIVQAYYQAARQASEPLADTPGWMPLFEGAADEGQDQAWLLQVIRAQMADDAAAEAENLGLSALALQSLTFLGGLIRNVRKRYHRGLAELQLTIDNLQPQLTSYQYTADRFQNQMAAQLIERKKDSIRAIAAHLQADLYQTALDHLVYEQLQPSQCKELKRGTAHKYHLTQEQVVGWEANRQKFMVLRQKLIGKIKQLYCRFQSLKEITEQQVEHYQRNSIKFFAQKFEEMCAKAQHFKTDNGHYFAAIQKVIGVITDLQSFDAGAVDFQTKKPKIQPMLYGVCYEAVEILKNERRIVLRLQSRIPGENIELEELEQDVFNYGYLRYVDHVEIGRDGGYDYYFVFEQPVGFLCLATMFSYLYQKIFGLKLMTQKQFDEIQKQMQPLESNKNQLLAVTTMYYNLMLLLRSLKKCEQVPFTTANVLVNPTTLQIVLCPLQHLPHSMLKLDQLVEFNFQIAAPECALGITNTKSTVWSIAMSVLMTLGLLKAAQSEAVKDTVQQLTDQLSRQQKLTNELFNANDQALKKQNSKFSAFDNDLGLNVNYCKALIALIRTSASVSSDIKVIPSAAQANELLLNYMESKNVQLANYVVSQAIIKPMISEAVKGFDARLFSEGDELVKKLIMQLNINEANIDKFKEFINGALVFSTNDRIELSACLKLKLFKPCAANVDKLQEVFENDLDKKNRLQEQKLRDTEIAFRNRPWRGKYEVEHTASMVKKVNAEAAEEPPKSESGENAWAEEQLKEQERFQRDGQKLQLVIQYEQQQENAPKNGHGRTQYDYDEGDRGNDGDFVPATRETAAKAVMNEYEQAEVVAKADTEVAGEKVPVAEVAEYDPFATAYEQFYDPYAVQGEAGEDQKQYDPYAQVQEAGEEQQEQQAYDPYAEQK